MSKGELAAKLVRFGIVGGTVMAFFMGLNWFLAPRVGAQVAFLLAYVPAVGLHFLLNKWWTFGCKQKSSAKQVAEYAFMVAVTFLIQWVVFTAVTSFTTVPPWVAAGVANGTQMAVSFLLMQRRVFVESR